MNLAFVAVLQWDENKRTKSTNECESIGKAMYADRPALRSLSELRGMPDIKNNRKHEV